MPLLALIVVLSALITPSAADLSRTGNVTLFADTLCREPVFMNSAIIGRDFCAHSESSDEYEGTFKSFRINERPWCDNGSIPYWNVFADEGCRLLLDSRPSRGPGNEASCIPVRGSGYKAYAFVCDGFDMAWGLRQPGHDDGHGDGDGDGESTDASTAEETTSSPATLSATAIDSTTTSVSETTLSSHPPSISQTTGQAPTASAQDPSPTSPGIRLRASWVRLFLALLASPLVVGFGP